ncbi:hypothetical protein H9I45_06245 [Polaribacter haliotis]|uniref:Phosphoribosylpyrophosphate synthetase n=1 Tax=Polaribacter haliotis TaxID=1888915 RepID=A0A7L8AJ60_9FLAO|nr:hypothetical protein [Polaribacter haliotis]QOD62042.1 hypothetical protein H9I45_06245 [Polaribacter haliotis]
MENAKNELELIKKYEEKGYTESYRVVDSKLIANNEKTKYIPKDVKIVAEHRFEGMSNPSDMSILYVLETKDTKGTLVAAYGATADLETAEFFKEIPDENISKDENVFM